MMLSDSAGQWISIYFIYLRSIYDVSAWHTLVSDESKTSIYDCPISYFSMTSLPNWFGTLSHSVTCGLRCLTGCAGTRVGWTILCLPLMLRKWRKTSTIHTRRCTNVSRSLQIFQVRIISVNMSYILASILRHFRTADNNTVPECVTHWWLACENDCS